MEERQKVRVRVRVRRKKRRSKKRFVLGCILLVLFLSSSVLSVVGYQTYNARYHNDLSLAQTGIQHLQKAEAFMTTWSQESLDTQLTGQAKQEFTSALKNFSLVNVDLQSLPELAQQVPVYGARLSAARHLVPLAMTLSQAGVSACDILNTLTTGLHDPLTPQGHGITLSEFATVSQDAQTLRSALTLATQEVNQLQPSDLQFDPRVSKLVDAFHKGEPLLQEALDALEKLLPIVPTLLGINTPANYLIEVLDATELRPGGGFIGNYGTATLSGGRLTSASITDSYLLDRPFEDAGHVIPYPAAYKWFTLFPSSWSLRDSNLDADFPTAARYAEGIYREEGGKVPVQGVIAITPALIEQVLTITGPVSVPEYHETITAQNIIARIHYYQLDGKVAGSSDIPSADGLSSQRKHFTALLAEHLLTRVRQLSSPNLSRLLLLVMRSVPSKDLQVYVNSDVAENLLHRFHLDASIQSPGSDSLLVVDTNIGGNKANSFIVTTMDDQVTIDNQGNAVHHLGLKYAWIIAGQNYGNSLYQDYVRVYVPSSSILLSQDGWQPRGTSNAFSRKVWAGLFTLSYGETRTITLVWKVPATANEVQGRWHYQYLLQRQASILWKLNLQARLPQCATVTNTSGGLTLSGKQEAKLTQWLTQDLNVGVDYACK